MNKPKKTTIDWRNPKEGWKLDYTWNPVIGCRRNCSYCYAKRMNTWLKWIPEWNKPQFFREKLGIPFMINESSTIFVGSISDICYWEPNWIARVLDVCQEANHHRFMFLTKDPTIYKSYSFPDNCWLGVTITGKEMPKKRRLAMTYQTHNKRFISIEPLLGDIFFSGCEAIPKGDFLWLYDLVIVGADTSPKPVIPKKEWIDSIKHQNIHYKSNIQKYRI